MAIRKPKGWGAIQPTVGYMVDWSDPINFGLKACLLYNEGAGTTAYDATGFANKGAIGSLATWGTGQLGKAISLPGTGSVNNQIIISNSSYVNVVGNFSIMQWVYPKISNAYQCLMSRNNGSGSNRQYSMFLSTNGVGKIYIDVANGGGGGDTSVTPNWVVSKWNLIGLTGDGVNIRIYVNGILAATTSSASLPTSQTYGVNMGGEQSGFPLNGLLGPGRIYARTLTRGEFARFYAEPFAGILTPHRRLWSGAAAAAGGTVLSRYYYNEHVARVA